MTLYDADQENINVKGRQGDKELRLNDMTNTKSDKGKVTLKHGLIFFSFHGKKRLKNTSWRWQLVVFTCVVKSILFIYPK